MTGEPYQLLPPLTDEEYAALRADIADRGVVVPVVVDQYGRTIDGHNRQAIAADLGIDCPTEIRQVADDTDARDLAYRLNLARRQLNREQRRELAAAELAYDPNRSDRAIGRLLGVDGKTVGSVRAALAEAEQHRAAEEERQRQRQDDEDAARIEQRVRAATDRSLKTWAAWVVAHDASLATGVLKHGQPELPAAAATVLRTFGCRDLGCRHAPPVTEGTTEPAAEIPQLPTPPLKQLGPYRVHGLTDRFPLLDPDEWAAFVHSVATAGVIYPITLTHDRSTLVDGRIRYLACQAVGIEPRYRTLPADYTDSQIVSYVVSANVHQCPPSLTKSQKALAEAFCDLRHR